MAIAQNEQQPQSIGLIVDSLEENKEFVFESLRDEDLTGLGIMANVTKIFV